MTEQITVALRREDGYRFRADFGLPGVPPLVLDEPAPLGRGEGPNAARILAAAVGHCLSASLMFCLQKARLDLEDISATVDVTLTRNERGRLRIGGMRVRLSPTLAPDDRGRMGRCLELFEDFCLVTASVREGIPVEVHVAAAEHASASS